jgi:hypothetical protein
LKGAVMPRYEVNMTVEFSGEIEANSSEEAEQKAWTAWGDTADCALTYDGVDNIQVMEIEDEDEDEDEVEDEDEEDAE